MLDARGIRPSVGFSVLTPQHCAGQRSDPPVSLPRLSGLTPVASAAASPPLEPPGVRDESQGFRVAPRSSLSVCNRMPSVERLVRPSGIAPAPFIRSTTGASRVGYESASALAPSVVGVPMRSRSSLMVNGTPWNGSRSRPAATARSVALAASNACSPRTTTALIDGLTASIRRRWASTTSTLDACLLLIAWASSVALILQSSAAVARLMPLPPWIADDSA